MSFKILVRTIPLKKIYAHAINLRYNKSHIYLQVLMLLINLVQNNDVNTQRLLSLRIRVDNEDDIISRSLPALDLIVDLFYKREDLAR